MSKGKLLAVSIIWLLIVGAIAVAYRTLIHPQMRQQRLAGTSSNSQYKFHIDLALDSFSGYAILRSPQMRSELASRRIRLNLVDDGADYSKRMDALRRGRVQMAVFTIDTLLKASAAVGDLPGTIVAIIDETRGADAVVAYRDAVPNLDALNRADMRFVLTPDSPSETLARVVMTHFNLDNLPASPFDPQGDAEAVYRVYRAASPETPQAFVLWEPYVSKILENPNTHVLTDSSKFRGYIVDVLVVNRDYLLKNADVVQDVLASYFRAAYHDRDAMIPLVLEDARTLGTPLSPAQAENLVGGIWWKNTQENFAHFGLREDRSIQLLEDMIANITRVLLSTNAMKSDPTAGRPSLLFYDGILRQLQASQFHPGLASEVIRDDKIELPPLTDAQWEKLVPLGTLSVPELVFARGTDRLTDSSRSVLDELVKTLDSFPQAYVMIRGNASRSGDLTANRELARRRAVAAERHLIDAGVSPHRVHALAGEPGGTTTVSFVLGQPPY